MSVLMVAQFWPESSWEKTAQAIVASINELGSVVAAFSGSISGISLMGSLPANPIFRHQNL
jgi:hypothetical protein